MKRLLCISLLLLNTTWLPAALETKPTEKSPAVATKLSDTFLTLCGAAQGFSAGVWLAGGSLHAVDELSHDQLAIAGAVAALGAYQAKKINDNNYPTGFDVWSNALIAGASDNACFDSIAQKLNESKALPGLQNAMPKLAMLSWAYHVGFALKFTHVDILLKYNVRP